MSEINNDQSLEKDDVLWLNDVKKAREIVQEILKFGVTQSQMKSIIGLLALELEDRELMINIRNTIDPGESEVTDNNHVKILYPGGTENE